MLGVINAGVYRRVRYSNCGVTLGCVVVFHDLFFLHTELGGLLKYVRPFLNSISKAKAARLVRSLLDLFLDMEAATGQEVRFKFRQ